MSIEITPLISAQEIQDRLRELGAQLDADYPDHNCPLILVGVLKGAFMVTADLARSISRDVEIDFITISSYDEGTETSGNVRVLKDLNSSVEGKDVLIVEDILDTGLTLSKSNLIEKLTLQKSNSVRILSLLDKPARRRAPITPDYCGFVIDDEFVVGYGMDLAELYRNLPYVGILSQAE